MIEPSRLSFASQGLRLNVWAWGDEKASPLVLMHGVRDHARSWDRIAAVFAGRYRVIAPDLRGHGDSAWSGFYPTEGYLADLAQMVETLGLAPFDLIGHSLGGNIGLRYAALFPDRVRRLVAIEGLSHAPALGEKQKPIETRPREWIARARDDKPPRRYASLEEATARLADHGDVGDGRVAEDRVFDLRRIDIFAPGHDHVLHPVVGEHEAFRVAIGRVASMHPAPAQSLGAQQQFVGNRRGAIGQRLHAGKVGASHFGRVHQHLEDRGGEERVVDLFARDQRQHGGGDRVAHDGRASPMTRATSCWA